MPPWYGRVKVNLVNKDMENVQRMVLMGNNGCNKYHASIRRTLHIDRRPMISLSLNTSKYWNNTLEEHASILSKISNKIPELQMPADRL